MRTTKVDVIRIPTKGPGDVSGLMRLIEAGKIKPASILAILGKTEGNGGVNDFTREYAVSALSAALAPHIGMPPRNVEQRIAFVMSGGTEGLLSPHLTVFARSALREVDGEIRDEQILKDWNLFSSVASTSAGIELMHNVVMVLGNSNSSASPFVIGHDVMRDSIDSTAVIAALNSVGLGLGDIAGPVGRNRLVNIFAKAEASPDGDVSGWRRTMIDDSDIGATHHARAAVGGLIGGLAGTGAVYVSGGAEHQGPPGGGPVAAIARL